MHASGGRIAVWTVVMMSGTKVRGFFCSRVPPFTGSCPRGPSAVFRSCMWLLVILSKCPWVAWTFLTVTVVVVYWFR